MNLKSALAVAFFLFVIIPCKADTLTVSSQFTFGPSFSDLSLSESGSFSFNWDTATNLILPDTIAYNFTGPLAPFALVSFGTEQAAHAPAPYPWVTWRNADQNFLQLALYDIGGGGFPRLGEYPALWGGPVQLWLPHDEEWPLTGSLTVAAATVTTPEPSSGLLLLMGIAGALVVALVFPRPALRRFS